MLGDLAQIAAENLTRFFDRLGDGELRRRLDVAGLITAKLSLGPCRVGLVICPLRRNFSPCQAFP